MTLEEVKCKLYIALNQLLENDLWLLHNNLNERTIAHKLAEYLQQIFPDHHVDCEYNRDVEQNSGLKKVNILKARYEDIKNIKVDGGSIDVSVFPDIVIHRRGSNKNNLLVIELKKSINKNIEACEFDKEKLRCFTDQSKRNTLKYNYGVFLILETQENMATTENFINYEQWFFAHNRKS